MNRWFDGLLAQRFDGSIDRWFDVSTVRERIQRFNDSRIEGSDDSMARGFDGSTMRSIHQSFNDTTYQ